MAKRHQNLESYNFLNSDLIATGDPIFSTERKYGVIKTVGKTDADALRNRFNQESLLSGIKFKNVHRASWVLNHGTKYKKSAIVSIGIEKNQRLPSFSKICEIFIIDEFLYFVTFLETVRFNYIFQSYEVKELRL